MSYDKWILFQGSFASLALRQIKSILTFTSIEIVMKFFSEDLDFRILQNDTYLAKSIFDSFKIGNGEYFYASNSDRTLRFAL